MNKYQEALEVFKEYVEWLQSYKMLSQKNSNYLDNKINNLQELVDKATPKKPIEYQNNRLYWLNKCPSCECDIENDYCSHCGQALDWSKE